MRYLLSIILLVLLVFNGLLAQNDYSPCSYEASLERLLIADPNAQATQEANEAWMQNFIREQGHHGNVLSGRNTTYTIPVVLHIFHDGEEGRIDMEQIQSGLDVLNQDMQGWNDDWNDIDPAFDSIKGSLDIHFCLATIDPDGNPTTGVNYYNDPDGMLNIGDLFIHAWDNYKYLNIYLPKYVFNGPSDFTAYAYLPSTANSDQNRDGIFYSSIRWGYGEQSELEPGQEWGSVITHEVGHWLNLQHTFRGGCSGSGDYVDDTPPTTGSGIELEGCYNNDFSCGVATNGENYMDYNHDCKKMFTQGQVERMVAALHLPSRMPLWSEENLMATGCADLVNIENLTLGEFQVFPNPAADRVELRFTEVPQILIVRNLHGQELQRITQLSSQQFVDLQTIPAGVYLLEARYEQRRSTTRLVKQ